MAPDREARLPTQWLSGLAQAHGARLEHGWYQPADFRGVLHGAYRDLPWTLTMDGHLDTDYPSTIRWQCSTPHEGSFSVKSGAFAGTTGTEADLVFAAVSAARAWWKQRNRTRDAGATGAPGASQPRSSTLSVSDPREILTPELLAPLEDWPPSTHVRGVNRNGEIRLSMSYGAIVFTTENQWGEAVTEHHLRVAFGLLDRLSQLQG